MKHTYTIEAETEADLTVHFNALSRYCADADFEAHLRGMWKHGDYTDAEYAIVEGLWEYWHETRSDIGEEQ